MLFNFSIDISDEGKRLDIWLSQQLIGKLSRSRIQQLIKQECVTLNQKIVTVVNTKLKYPAQISV